MHVHLLVAAAAVATSLAPRDAAAAPRRPLVLALSQEEPKPEEAKPAEAKPEEAAPEAAPAEKKPEETKPAETLEEHKPPGEDNDPPTIAHTPVAHAPRGKPLRVEAHVIDPAGVFQVVLYLRRAGGSDYIPL